MQTADRGEEAPHVTEGLAGPAVVRRRLGSKLKELRGQMGYPLDTVARALEFSTAKLSRLETGQVSPKIRDVRDLLEMYDVRPDLRQRIMSWAEEAKHEGWWQPLPSEDTPVDLDLYISLEAEAESISQFSTSVVPGLLQTRAYAEVVLADAFRSAPPAALTKFANIRMGRQAVLARSRPDVAPLALHVVLDEALLYRRPRPDEEPSRSQTLLRDQLQHLVAVADWPNVTLQVFRFDGGFTHAGSVLTIFRPREASDWPVVNSEGPVHDPFYSDEEDVEMYEQIWSDLVSRALGEAASKQLIQDRADDLKAAGVPDDPAARPPA